MASLKELIAQKEAIDREIAQQQQQDRGEAITQIRSLMDAYGLTVADLSGKVGAKARPGMNGKVAAKYRDKATGDSWSGRGLQPKWLRAAIATGRQVNEFAV